VRAKAWILQQCVQRKGERNKQSRAERWHFMLSFTVGSFAPKTVVNVLRILWKMSIW
jgi:hypothetical protein